MKTKIKEKQLARELRQDGYSLKDIATQLNVAKSSVSNWVRDIPLSEEHKELLQQNNKLNWQQVQHLGHQAVRYRSAKKRVANKIIHQQIGRERAKQKDWLHTIGCMLYWAEGTKGKYKVEFSNTDLHMHKLFLAFLLNNFDVDISQITLRCQIHSDDEYRKEEIEQYWLNALGLTVFNLRKTTVKASNKERKSKNKLPYGTCLLAVCRTDILNQIYGAIQEYGNFTNNTW